MSDFELTPPDPKDDRFKRFKLLIEQMFMWRWHVMPRWGASEGDQLKRFIRENPTLTEYEVKRALYNLSQSSDIPEMQRPSRWLPRLESYVVHNHNVYGRDPNANQQQSFAEKDANATREAVERIRADRRRRFANVQSLGKTIQSGPDSSISVRPSALSSGSD